MTSTMTSPGLTGSTEDFARLIIGIEVAIETQQDELASQYCPRSRAIGARQCREWVAKLQTLRRQVARDIHAIFDRHSPGLSPRDVYLQRMRQLDEMRSEMQLLSPVSRR
jgi:hypothetical protein